MATRDDVIAVLKTIEDPEIFVDIWTLGLIYDIDLQDPAVNIKMTFTSIGCPAGPYLVDEVTEKLKELPDIDTVKVEVVFQPPWKPSDELKALLGM